MLGIKGQTQVAAVQPALSALPGMPSTLEYEMELLCFTGEEGIHSCFALQLITNERSNISNALLCLFMTLMFRYSEFLLELSFMRLWMLYLLVCRLSLLLV